MKNPKMDYRNLSPQERFELLVAALTRNDDGERDRLMAACPTANYTAPAPAMRDRMDAHRRVAILANAQVHGQARLALTLRAVAFILDVELLAVSEFPFETLGEGQKVPLSGKVHFLKGMAEAARTALMSQVEAVGQLALVMGVSLESFLNEETLDLFAKACAPLPAPESDPEQVVAYRALLVDYAGLRGPVPWLL